MQIVRARHKSAPQFLAPTSFFNRPLGPADTVAVDQSAARYVSNMFYYGYQGAQHTWYGYSGPGYGAYNWPAAAGFSVNSTTFPCYAVRPSDPSQNISVVQMGMWQGNPAYPMGTSYDNLQSFMNAVPIPDKSLCPMITGSGVYTDIWSGANNSERCCFIWDLDTDRGYELFQMQNSDTAKSNLFTPSRMWTAGYGGYIPAVSTWNGVFTNGVWGADGTGLAAFGGLITMQDLRDVWAGGTIEHALAFASGYNSGTKAPIPPATRRDGYMTHGNTTQFIPAGYPNAGQPNPAYHIDVSDEAQRFRFAPGTTNANIGNFAQYPLAREMTRAIERYGMYNVNTTAAMSFYLEDPRTQGSPYHLQGASAVDPIRGLDWSKWVAPGLYPWSAGNASTSWTVLNVMPWDALQLLDPVTG